MTPELVPGTVLGWEGPVSVKVASPEGKWTDLSVCFLGCVFCETGHFFFPLSWEVDQVDGCLVLQEEEEGGGRHGLAKELKGFVACWLSPMRVPSVFFPLPMSMGGSGIERTLGRRESLLRSLISGRLGRGVRR